ncbi:MAG: hypothetical protein HYT37_04320 [Candidatus Sungbacteria bacterium]|nr:hypothetical protein [Candidatus Sungbacteria bacterium]
MQKKQKLMLVWYVKSKVDFVDGRRKLLGLAGSEEELDRFVTRFQSEIVTYCKREVSPLTVDTYKRFEIRSCNSDELVCVLEVSELHYADPQLAAAIHEAFVKELQTEEDFRCKQRMGHELPQGREWPPYR